MENKPYIRASAKQLEYIAYLCKELNCTNKYLYQYCSMDLATKEIKKLKRRLVKQQEQQRQVVLL